MQFIKDLRQFITEPLKFISTMHQQHGNLFSIRLGFKKIYFACHADFAEDVLVKKQEYFQKSRLIFKKIIPITGTNGLVQLENEEWKSMRKLTGEIFQSHYMKKYPDMIHQNLDELVITLKSFAEEKQTVNLFSLLASFSIKVAAQIIFGNQSSKTLDDMVSQFIELNYLCGNRMKSPFALPLIIPTRLHVRIKKLNKKIRKNIKNLIKLNQSTSSNLLSILEEKLPNRSKLIEDQLLTFLFASYETTSASLLFTFYLLAKNQDYQHKIRMESNIKNLRLRQLTYAVYCESLRLYPPAWILAREVIRPVNVGDKYLKKGDVLILGVREIQRHHELWEHAEQFMPERFLKKDKIAKYAFIPFGMGKRICTGNQVAIMEALMTLPTLCQHFEFATTDTLELDALVTLHPKNTIRFSLVPIKIRELI